MDDEYDDPDFRQSAMKVFPPARESKPAPIPQQKYLPQGDYIDLSKLPKYDFEASANSQANKGKFFNFFNPANIRKKVTRAKRNDIEIGAPQLQVNKNLDAETKNPNKVKKKSSKFKTSFDDAKAENLAKDNGGQKGRNPRNDEQKNTDFGEEFANLTRSKLTEILKDFYSFHDPFKGEREIEKVVQWTKKHGIKSLNAKLMKKYKEDLLVKEEVEDESRKDANLKDAGLSEKANVPVNQNITTNGFQPKKYVLENRDRVVSSVRIMSNLVTPGLVERYQEDDFDPEEPQFRNRSSTVVESEQLKKRLEICIKNLEMANTPEEIKQGIISFYRLAAPTRLKMWEKNESGSDFIGEILSWTFRFGLARLVNNLKVKYLGLPSTFPSIDFRATTNMENAVSFDKSFKLKPDSALGKTNEKLPQSPGSINKWKDAVKIRTYLERFYRVYNPARLNEPLEDLISYILSKGVEKFNEKLRVRYDDDLFSFENETHVEYRAALMEKLFAFYSKLDPNRIGAGLSQLIEWTERNGETKLNRNLRKKYGRDLTNFEE